MEKVLFLFAMLTIAAEARLPLALDLAGKLSTFMVGATLEIDYVKITQNRMVLNSQY